MAEHNNLQETGTNDKEVRENLYRVVRYAAEYTRHALQFDAILTDDDGRQDVVDVRRGLLDLVVTTTNEKPQLDFNLKVSAEFALYYLSEEYRQCMDDNYVGFMRTMDGIVNPLQHIAYAQQAGEILEDFGFFGLNS